MRSTFPEVVSHIITLQNKPSVPTCLTRGSSVCKGVTGEEMYCAMGAALAPATIRITLSPTGCCCFLALSSNQLRKRSPLFLASSTSSPCTSQRNSLDNGLSSEASLRNSPLLRLLSFSLHFTNGEKTKPTLFTR